MFVWFFGYSKDIYFRILNVPLIDSNDQVKFEREIEFV